MTTDFPYIILGILLLILGRRLFWLFVAAVGMAAGLMVARQLLPLQPEWITLLMGLAIGAIGALLAIFFQKAAILLAGFAAGATATLQILTFLAWPQMPFIVLGGGIAGAIILFLLFDWGLIALSSLAGAAMIIQAWTAPPQARLWFFQALAIIGVVIQSWFFIRQKRPTRISRPTK